MVFKMDVETTSLKVSKKMADKMGKRSLYPRIICCIGVMLGALMWGCSDETPLQTEVDTGGTVTDVTREDTTTSDTGEGEVQTCTAADNICLGQIQRQICQSDGTLKVENCVDTQRCFNGACGDIICDAGRVDACEGFRYQGCNAAGTGEGVFDCPTGLTCVGDACVARLCMPGEVRCKDEAGVVQGDAFLECNEAGTAFEDLGNSCTDNDVKSVCDGSEAVHACKSLCDTIVKSASYIGCDYWAVDLDNSTEGLSEGTAGAFQIYAVVVSNATPDLTANVLVYDVEGYAKDPKEPLTRVEVPPGELAVLPLPPDCYDQSPACAKAHQVNNTTQVPAAYRIVADVPITAYQFNPLDNRVQAYSNDASLLFPEPSLGVRYLAMAAGTKWGSSPSFVTIVGTGTEEIDVTVKPRIRTMPGRTSLGVDIPAMDPGQTYNFKLKPFDVLNIASGREDTYDPSGNSIPSGDLTGTEIFATGRVAVFAGTECTEVPNTNPRTGACDHMEQQIYPVNSWGLVYHAPKSWPRGGSRDMWRLMARQDGTVVTTTPDQLGSSRTLNAGEWVDFMTTESFVVKANRPILVGQYLTGEGDPIDRNLGETAGIGDPTYISGVPVEQYRTDYIFLAPDAYAQDYISIASKIMTEITLDGVILTDEVLAERGALVEPLGDSGYEAIRLLISDGPHRLTASEPVGLYVYGFDRYVSYGYPAGLNLDDLTRRPSP
jgi:hypothetical protein